MMSKIGAALLKLLSEPSDWDYAPASGGVRHKTKGIIISPSVLHEKVIVVCDLKDRTSALAPEDHAPLAVAILPIINVHKVARTYKPDVEVLRAALGLDAEKL